MSHFADDARNNGLSLLRCPSCRGRLHLDHSEYCCDVCGLQFEVVNGIPSLFLPNERGAPDDITRTVRDFYESTPFPNYDGFDDVGTLIEKSRKGLFSRLLDDQIPLGSNVLDCGCGTGQLANFLAVANRQVHGADMCMNSLRLATDFKRRNALSRVEFVQMNLFRPCFQDGEFDLVISNGVLHHTSNPWLAFEAISRLVKPGGYVLVGLYHRYGRLATDVRRRIFDITGDRMKWLDRRWASGLGEARRETWFLDQYKNPHESKHTVDEVLKWFERSGFSFVRTIPSTAPLHRLDGDTRLFEAEPLSGPLARAVTTGAMVLSGHREGGFFIMIGKKQV